MSDEGMDLCGDIWSHEIAMRRLLSLLRQSQNQCNDIECFQSTNDPTSGDNMMFMTFCWAAVIFILYLLRPKSIRNREKDMKAANFGNDEDRNPPPSPNVL